MRKFTDYDGVIPFWHVKNIIEKTDLLEKAQILLMAVNFALEKLGVYVPITSKEGQGVVTKLCF